MQELLSKYQLQSVLGIGVTSTIRKAIHIASREEVAIKIISFDEINCPINMIRNQTQILMRLDHPNIISIYDIIEQPGKIYIVMEYMAGGELYDHIAQKKRFGEVEACIFLRKIIDAVRYCHDNQIIHRDIKAENLLLSTNGPDCVLKLADFGLAKVLESPSTGTFCGTLEYMAPQILSNQRYGTKVDIWSIGVTMFYMLSGQYPFKGSSQGSQLQENIKSGNYNFMGNTWSMISYKAKSLIKRMLSLNPEQRPTAQQLIDDEWFMQTMVIQAKRSINLEYVINKIKKTTMRKKVHKTIGLISEIVKVAENEHYKKMKQFTLTMN